MINPSQARLIAELLCWTLVSLGPQGLTVVVDHFYPAHSNESVSVVLNAVCVATSLCPISSLTFTKLYELYNIGNC